MRIAYNQGPPPPPKAGTGDNDGDDGSNSPSKSPSPAVSNALRERMAAYQQVAAPETFQQEQDRLREEEERAMREAEEAAAREAAREAEPEPEVDQFKGMSLKERMEAFQANSSASAFERRRLNKLEEEKRKAQEEEERLQKEKEEKERKRRERAKLRALRPPPPKPKDMPELSPNLLKERMAAFGRSKDEEELDEKPAVAPAVVGGEKAESVDAEETKGRRPPPARPADMPEISPSLLQERMGAFGGRAKKRASHEEEGAEKEEGGEEDVSPAEEPAAEEVVEAKKEVKPRRPPPVRPADMPDVPSNLLQERMAALTGAPTSPKSYSKPVDMPTISSNLLKERMGAFSHGPKADADDDGRDAAPDSPPTPYSKPVDMPTVALKDKMAAYLSPKAEEQPSSQSRKPADLPELDPNLLKERMGAFSHSPKPAAVVESAPPPQVEDAPKEVAEANVDAEEAPVDAVVEEEQDEAIEEVAEVTTTAVEKRVDAAVKDVKAEDLAEEDSWMRWCLPDAPDVPETEEAAKDVAPGAPETTVEVEEKETPAAAVSEEKKEPKKVDVEEKKEAEQEHPAPAARPADMPALSSNLLKERMGAFSHPSKPADTPESPPRAYSKPVDMPNSNSLKDKMAAYLTPKEDTDENVPESKVHSKPADMPDSNSLKDKMAAYLSPKAEEPSQPHKPADLPDLDPNLLKERMGAFQKGGAPEMQEEVMESEPAPPPKVEDAPEEESGANDEVEEAPEDAAVEEEEVPSSKTTQEGEKDGEDAEFESWMRWCRSDAPKTEEDAPTSAEESAPEVNQHEQEPDVGKAGVNSLEQELEAAEEALRREAEEATRSEAERLEKERQAVEEANRLERGRVEAEKRKEQRKAEDAAKMKARRLESERKEAEAERKAELERLERERIAQERRKKEEEAKLEEASSNGATAINDQLTVPRELTPDETAQLRGLLRAQLSISSNDDDTDADDLLDYARDMIEGGENIGHVADEMKFMEMPVCGEEEAKKVGACLTKFFGQLGQ